MLNFRAASRIAAAGVLSLCILSSPGLLAPARAVDQRSPTEPVFGIRAGLFGQTELPGEHFTYGLTPGSGVDDSVVLYNFTDQPIDLVLYPADVRTAEGGALAPEQLGTEMRQIGAWVKLDASHVTIPPKADTTVNFRLDLPIGSVPGHYVGAIVASLSEPDSPGRITVETRAARLIRLEVPGESKLGVELSALTMKETGNGKEFAVTIRNTGNVLFTPDGVVIMDGVDPIELGPRDIYVVPGGTARFTGIWRAVPLVARKTARATIVASVPGQKAETFRTGGLTVTLFPFKAAARFLGAGVLLALVLFFNRRRTGAWLDRRRRERIAVSEFRAGLRYKPVSKSESEPPDKQDV